MDYRLYVQRLALSLNLTGSIILINQLHDGFKQVFVTVQGYRENIVALIFDLWRGPATVTNIDTHKYELPKKGEVSVGFVIPMSDAEVSEETEPDRKKREATEKAEKEEAEKKAAEARELIRVSFLPHAQT